MVAGLRPAKKIRPNLFNPRKSVSHREEENFQAPTSNFPLLSLSCTIMKVCIAEKPSVGREIAQIIGARTRHDGYYEGNGYCVTWTFGHFCTLKEPDDYRAEWKKWDFNTLPILPEKFDIKLIKNAGAKKQFGIIKTLLKKADEVINCGDAGQEGELIQRWVLKQAKYKGPIRRLWISSLTPEAIRDGFQHLKPASDYDNLYYAGSSRAIGDWILGMNATRLFTLKYGGFKQLLSIGRVQTPTLAMLVERYWEIEKFVPKPYWELSTIYRDTLFSCEKGRFEKVEDGAVLLQQITGKPFTVLSCEKKKGKEYPPRLFDLTSLQVHCNKRFGFSADRTLKIVQTLYEQKVVTYPRVDTTYLPNDIYPKVPATLQRMTSYSQFTQPLLGKTLRKSTKVFDDKKVTDHHAIIPTGYEKSLMTEEQNVYDAIARRFIAVFYPDCMVSNTKVIGAVDGIRFKATGKEILEEGWRVLFPPRRKSTNADGSGSKKDNEEKVLPSFKKGETGPHKPTLVEKMTQPPKHYTEATLLRGMETAGKKVDDEALRELMKANGIGRPSTRANIIETLFRRRYVERKRKNLIATNMGIQLIGKIQTELLKSAELTGQWEKQLRDIESGEHSAGQFIKDMKKMVTDLVYEVRMSDDNRKIVAVDSTPSRGRAKGQKSATPRKSKAGKGKVDFTTLTCLKCRKGKLMKGKTAFGCSEWKAGCNFRLPFKFKEKKLPETQLARLMKQGSTVKLKGFKENGNKVAGKARFNEAFELVLEAGSTATGPPKSKTGKAPPTITCPKCKKGKVMKGKTAYGCSDWKSGCDFRFTFDAIREAAGGEKLTRALVVRILSS